MQIRTVVFDLGGVLIDWDPRYLYRKIFSSPAAMEDFLTRVCNQEWNEKQDAGRSFREGVAELIALHPEFRAQIEAYQTRWPEMLGGAVLETVEILNALKTSGHQRLLALSNWSQETFVFAEERFEFLRQFEAIVVSGRLRIKKPDPEIFRYLCRTHQVQPTETVFIDDSMANIKAAGELGFHALHFTSPGELAQSLRAMGLLTVSN